MSPKRGRLPQLLRIKVVAPADNPLVRLEAAVAKYAGELTDARVGLLANRLTVADNFKGQVVTVSGFVAPAAPAPPAVWPVASQVTLVLGETFPGAPAQVLVQDAVTGSGVHVGPLTATWVVGANSAGPTVTLQRIDGLQQGVKYTLTVAVLAA